MCRWLVWCSDEPITLEDIVLAPTNSLLQQSFSAGFHPGVCTRNNMPLNADGFGLGWFHATRAGRCGGPRRGAATFRSITPAWNNRNLRELCSAVESTCILAHVRAASAKSVVSEENCHPFKWGPLLFQHNGHVEDFPRIRRRVLNSLRADVFAAMEGTTDSEACFALILTLLDPEAIAAGTLCAAELQAATLGAIAIIRQLLHEEGITHGYSTLNWALTDGETVIVTRYCDKAPHVPPPSLYYAFTDGAELRNHLQSNSSETRGPAAFGQAADATTITDTVPMARSNENMAAIALPPSAPGRLGEPTAEGVARSSSGLTSHNSPELSGVTGADRADDGRAPSAPSSEPASSRGESPATCRGRPARRVHRCQRGAFVCASEPLTHRTDQWHLIEENTMLCYTRAGDNASELVVDGLPNDLHQLPTRADASPVLGPRAHPPADRAAAGWAADIRAVAPPEEEAPPAVHVVVPCAPPPARADGGADAPRSPPGPAAPRSTPLTPPAARQPPAAPLSAPARGGRDHGVASCVSLTSLDPQSLDQSFALAGRLLMPRSGSAPLLAGADGEPIVDGDASGVRAPPARACSHCGAEGDPLGPQGELGVGDLSEVLRQT